MDRTGLSQFEFIKKVMKLMLLSVSLFFILFSYSSSSWYSFFLQLLNHAMNKKCLFLICNGIVVLLVESSGFFIHFSPENNLNDIHLFTKIGDHGKGFPSSYTKYFSLLEREVSPHVEEAAADEEALSLDPKVSLFEREVSPHDGDSNDNEEEESSSSELGKSKDSNLIEKEGCGHFDVQHTLLCILHNEFPKSEGAEHAIEEEEERENELGTIGLGIEEEQGGGGGGENGMEISREELNRKCDEFIRRMKEEIRIGAQNKITKNKIV